MLLALKLKAAMAAAALAAPVALAVAPAAVDRPATDSIFAAVPATDYQYRVAGEFSLNGKPAEAPLRTIRLRSNLRIMNRLVTAGEYAACASEGACPPIPLKAAAGDRAIVGVSWRDATAYAQWMTRKTGVLHRLPTDEEWVAAAGEKAANETQALVDPSDPAQAWIARYDTEANRARPFALDPQPIGTFGRNQWGLHDVGGNVWEWTNTCFLRFSIEPNGSTRVVSTNCGVRVVQGAHRTYMTDFIRDPRSGGCAVGVPPANLGFRLLIEDEKLPALNRIVERAFTLAAISF